MPFAVARIHHSYLSHSYSHGTGHPISEWLFLLLFVGVFVVIGALWLVLGGTQTVSRSVRFGSRRL